jgi:hypothetical protein
MNIFKAVGWLLVVGLIAGLSFSLLRYPIVKGRAKPSRGFIGI